MKMPPINNELLKIPDKICCHGMCKDGCKSLREARLEYFKTNGYSSRRNPVKMKYRDIYFTEGGSPFLKYLM